MFLRLPSLLLPLNGPLTANRSPLTLEQPLKSALVPPPPKAVSTNGSPADDEEPTLHTCSKHNPHDGGIEDAALKMFTREKVRTFCDFVTSLARFVMSQNDMKQPFNASTITIEGDVTAYLEVKSSSRPGTQSPVCFRLGTHVRFDE